MKPLIMNYERRTNQGFTLIELIVVIAIISILSGVLMTNFVGIRERTRDAQRKSDARNLQSALELYRADEGEYPPTADLDVCGDGNSLTSSDGASTYLLEIPCDPLGSSAYNSGVYYYESDGSVYELVACLENESDSDSNATTSPGVGEGDCDSGLYFYVTNP